MKKDPALKKLALYRIGAAISLLVILAVGCNLTAAQTTPTAALATFTAPQESATMEAAPTASKTLAATSSPGETQTAEVTQPSGETSTDDQSNALLPGAPGTPSDLPGAPYYSINLKVDFANHSYSGSESIQVTNTENVPLDSLFFHLLPNSGASFGDGSLVASDIQAGGSQVNSRLSVQDSILEVPLSNPLQPGDKIEVYMQFQGKVPLNFGSGQEQGYGIFNFSDNVMSISAWYPLLAVYDDNGWNLDPASNIGDSVYADMAFYDVEVATSEDVIAVATGTEIEGEDGTADSHFTFASGPVREFYLALSPDFKIASQDAGGVMVRSYYLRGSEAGAEKALSIGLDSLQIFIEHFGPYPYNELDIVQAPMRYAAGVEFPGIILIAGYLYDRYQQDFFDEVVAHEVAHQWWYNLVGNDVFDEPWLDEALATYSSSLYYEFELGTRSADQLIQGWWDIYSRAADEGTDDQVTQTLQYFESQDDENLYSVVVYIKGALFFEELRKKIGDEAFFGALQHYYQADRYKIATRQDLLSAFEEASGQDLSDFYQEWLFSSGT